MSKKKMIGVPVLNKDIVGSEGKPAMLDGLCEFYCEDVSVFVLQEC